MDENSKPKSVLDSLGEEIVRIITPVSICMLLVVILVTVLNNDTDSSNPSFTSIATVAYNESSSDSNWDKLKGALLNALVFVVVVTVVTFLLVLLFYFRCTKFLKYYMGFSSFLVLGFMGGEIAIFLIGKFRVPIDCVSFGLILFNFTVVGVLAVFMSKMAIVVTQGYLVVIGVLVAYWFTMLPEWTTWVLLVAMALYDLAAVLLPGGPLRLLVELAMSRDEDIPALVYEARPVIDRESVPRGGFVQRRVWRERRENEFGSDENLDSRSNLNSNVNSISESRSVLERRPLYGSDENERNAVDMEDGQVSREDSELAAPLIQHRINVRMNLQEGSNDDFALEGIGLGSSVARAAMYDFMTVYACYLAIIAGLGITLMLLAFYQKALPALPVSVLLGSSDGMCLFCLGIFVGIISSFWKNRKEMDKLNDLLRQSEYLVQHLQEELEMKDSLTVKELATEDCESQDTLNDSSNNGALQASHNGALQASSSTNYDDCQSQKTEEESRSKIEAELEAELERLELSINSSTLEGKLAELDEASHNGALQASSSINYDDCQSQKTEEESRSKIEVELEAELERLELSINSSTLEGKLAKLDEVDPDFVADLAEGELRTELFNRQGGGQPYADQDGSGTSTPHPINYAVSPRELRLRLHEVLQSQLEERVKKLEMSLQNNERKVRYMEAELASSWRDSSNSEGGSSSTHGSPIAKTEQRTADQPVAINLCGDALDAYNEAYDVFTRLSSEEEDVAVALGVKDINHQENSRSREHNFDWNENDGMSDDEMEKLLIRHLVEKARKGSPAVLNVQRALFSLDDNEH